MDTDDGVETVVTFKYLREIVKDSGIRIEGVNVTKSGAVSSVTVCPPKSVSPSQGLKMRVLLGVDVKTSGDEVVDIEINYMTVTKGVIIRLSDFGSKVKWQLLCSFGHEIRETPITLVIDDKIEIYGNASSLRNGSVRFDIREVSNEDVVSEFYQAAYNSHLVESKYIESLIVDRPDRLRLWEVAQLFGFGSPMTETNLKTVRRYKDKSMLAKLVYRLYGEEFFALANRGVDADRILRFRNADVPGAVHAVLRVTHGISYDIETDYPNLFKHRASVILLLRRGFAGDKIALHRFSNYMECFEINRDLKEVYLTLCRKLSDALNNSTSMLRVAKQYEKLMR